LQSKLLESAFGMMDRIFAADISFVQPGVLEAAVEAAWIAQQQPHIILLYAESGMPHLCARTYESSRKLQNQLFIL
jgi:hypothetical protein